MERAEGEGDRRRKLVRNEAGKQWDGKGGMVKSRWVGWKGQSNLISSALSQSIHMPRHLSHTQRAHTVGQLKDFAEMSLPRVTSQANKQYNGTRSHAHKRRCAHVQATLHVSAITGCSTRGGSEAWSCLSCLSSPINYNYWEHMNKRASLRRDQ